jgi:hypothetical protein
MWMNSWQQKQVNSISSHVALETTAAGSKMLAVSAPEVLLLKNGTSV